MKILSIEDQPLSLKWKYHYLEERGHELVVNNMLGTRWELALEQAKAADIVMLDLMADPGVLFGGEKFEGDSGVELLRRMRAGGFSGPVYVLTKKNLPAEKSRQLMNELGVARCRLKTTVGLVELERELVEIADRARGEMA